MRLTTWIPAFVTIGWLLLIVSCSKEPSAPPTAPEVRAEGITPKGGGFPGFIQHFGQCQGSTFRVWKGCNNCYGQVTTGNGGECDGALAYIVDYDFPEIWTSGTCQVSVMHCTFEGGPDANTLGPSYLIVPPCGGTSYVNRSKLRIRFYGVSQIAQSPGCAWFTYNEASNTWSAAPGANTYFQWSTITTPPLQCCLPQ